jgi:hypothetical protein
MKKLPFLILSFLIISSILPANAASKLGVIAKVTTDSKLNILVTGVKSTPGSDNALVFCSILVYDWGLADHLGGVYYKQGEQDFSVPMNFTSLKELPTSFHLRNCKENQDASFAIHWKKIGNSFTPSFEKLKKLANLQNMKSYIPDAPNSEAYINTYGGVREEYYAFQGKITGNSTLSYFASYPKDICKTVATGSDGRNIKLVDDYFDRMHGYGQAVYRSDVKEIIKYKISCEKSGEALVESEHLEGRGDIRSLKPKPSQSPTSE